MKDFNIKRLEGYTIMSNHHLRDQNLSHSARGLLSFLLSLPNNWDYSFNGLVAISKEGKDAVRRMLNELKESKYIKISQYRDEKGYFKYHYDVYEYPYDMSLKLTNYPKPDFPVSDNRVLDKPISEKLQQINNKEINTNKINTNQINNIKKKEEELVIDEDLLDYEWWNDSNNDLEI